MSHVHDMCAKNIHVRVSMYVKKTCTSIYIQIQIYKYCVNENLYRR